MRDITVNVTGVKNEVKSWNWADSVTKVQNLYNGEWSPKSKELLELLYTAKKQLNRGVGNPHGRKSWKSFCEDCFLDKATGKMVKTQKTIDTWLKKYEMGDDEWNALKASKGPKAPSAVDDDMLLIKRVIKVDDDNYILRVQLSEYPEQLFDVPVAL